MRPFAQGYPTPIVPAPTHLARTLKDNRGSLAEDSIIIPVIQHPRARKLATDYVAYFEEGNGNPEDSDLES